LRSQSLAASAAPTTVDNGIGRRNSTIPQAGTPGELAEVLVEGQQDAVFAYRPGKDILVFGSGSCSAHPDHVVSRSPQRSHRIAWEILVGEEAHLTLRSD
jgi:hypothetical protein